MKHLSLRRQRTNENIEGVESSHSSDPRARIALFAHIVIRPCQRLDSEDDVKRRRGAFGQRQSAATMSVPSSTASMSCRWIRELTSGVLLALAGLHVAWGFGSSFLFRDRVTLADAVTGTDEVPTRCACFTVAAILAVGSALAADGQRLPRTLRSRGLRAMAAVLGMRGVVGLLNKTSLICPGSDSTTFQRRDRTWYAPLSVCLACGALFSARRM